MLLSFNYKNNKTELVTRSASRDVGSTALEEPCQDQSIRVEVKKDQKVHVGLRSPANDMAFLCLIIHAIMIVIKSVFAWKR